MKANTKRIMSFVLSMVLLFAMMPTVALAEETENGKVNITSSTLVGTWKYDQYTAYEFYEDGRGCLCGR